MEWIVGIGIIGIVFMIYYVRKVNSIKTSKRVRKMSNMGFTTLVSEIETNLSIATSIIVLENNVSYEQLIQKFEESICSKDLYTRFRSKVVHGHFVEMKQYKLHMNMKKAILDENQSPRAFAEEITNTTLDVALPLWECFVIENYEKQTVLVWRMHHCIGDGVSTTTAFAKLGDDGHLLEERVLAYMKSLALNAPKSLKNLSSEKSKPNMVQSVLQLIWALWVCFRKLAMFVLRPEPSTVFKAQGGRQKALRYDVSLSVGEVKGVGKKCNATINDVMLNSVAGALRLYLEKMQPHVLHPKLKVRAAIPVDMRPGGAKIKRTGNQFSSLLVELPLGVQDSKERLRLIQMSTNEAKFSMEKVIVYFSAYLMAYLPEFILRRVVGIMAKQVTIAISNVRGPPVDLYILGEKVVSAAGFVPPPPSVNIGIVIFSTGDQLGITLSADKQAISDPTFIMDGILQEYHNLRKSLV